MSSEIIGQTLSLITKAESRYQGTLLEVDTVKKTMSLKNVRNMGTEGRRNGVNEIAATDSILGMVKFKVELIKEFNIVKGEETEEDPAILESTEADPAVEEQKEKGPWQRGTKVVTSKGDEVTDETPEEDPKNGEPKPEGKKEYQPRQRKENYTEDRRGQRGELKENTNEYMQKKYAPDSFDFNTVNKDLKSEENKGEGETKEEKPKYVKNDFFDSITNSTLEEKQNQRGGRGGYRGGNRGGDF